MDKILVTGCAGFIGFHVCKMLCEEGRQVVGIDNLNDYYDPQLKADRLKILRTHENFLMFDKIDFYRHKDSLHYFFLDHEPDKVIHLGAQAGVRHSLEHPQDYIDNNITGFLNILECCRIYDVKQLLHASSSSVYGAQPIPFSENTTCNSTMNMYAVSKKCNENMAYAYNNLYGLKSIGLRFFTVYGPWGRPDMALFKFTKNIIEGKPIDVYNDGQMLRDFTYIDDIVEGIKRLMDLDFDYNIFNIGCGGPSHLLDFVDSIENKLKKPAIINFIPDLQPGDIQDTWCSTEALEQATGYKPKTTIKEGISKFIDWYVEYYGVKL